MSVSPFKMRSLLSAMVVVFAANTVAQEDKITFESQALGSGLFVVKGAGGFTGGNIVLSVGDDAVVMIDDSMPPFLDRLRGKIKELAGKPVDFLINTHVHADHTGNNAAFAETKAHIIAHSGLRARMLADLASAGKTSAGLPVLSFDQSMSLHLNGQDAQLLHLPNAHTDGDIVVFFQPANVFHTGDILFNGLFPFIDLDNGGSVDGYIAAQQTIVDMISDDVVIVPGHGPLASRADLQRSLDMLRDAKAKVKALMAEGLSESDIIARDPLAAYKEWSWSFISTEKFIATLFKDLGGAE